MGSTPAGRANFPQDRGTLHEQDPAIIITIMVLELKVPHGIDLATLKPLVQAVGKDWKGIVSPILYVAVAMMCLVPNQRIKKALARPEA